jgi:hypoxanthine-DNA glycosylase
VAQGRRIGKTIGPAATPRRAVAAGRAPTMFADAMPRDNALSASPQLRSFEPFADARSRVLVLGTMPGTKALRIQQYYGYERNHFWPIMFDLLAGGRVLDYPEKIALLRRHRIALWDVLASCERVGAADAAIKNGVPNAIPELLERHPGIHTVFCNGGLSAKLFRQHFGDQVAVPMIDLPSTSPAHAAMPYAEKRARWTLVIEYARRATPPRARKARATR